MFGFTMRQNLGIFTGHLPFQKNANIQITNHPTFTDSKQCRIFRALLANICFRNIFCQVTTEWCGRQGGKVANLSEVSAKEFQILVPTFG